MKLKEGICEKDLFEMTPWALLLLANFNLYCEVNGLPLVITSIKSDSKNVKRVSKTHSTGRAIDISVKGWTETEINKAVAYFNRRFRHIGAVSYSDGKPRAIVYHNSGYGDHFHLQVRPMDEKVYKIKDQGLLARTLNKFPNIF